ncbi:MAG: heme exporter protein CcmB [Chloroflexi bacterium]|nr:heme exporter protein CcmB [Chloroflexota bacterium]
MRSLWGPVLAILWKDLLLEARTKEVVTPVVVFALLVVVVFNFAFEPRPSLVAVVAAGVLWVSFVFAGLLGLGRTFAMEKEQGGLQGLMLCPVGRDVIYLGKFLGSFLFLLAVEAVMLPIFSILFNLPLVLPALWLVSALATFGFVAVGTVFSAMAVNTRAREIMLPVLFFPIAVPVIIAAVEVSGAILQGEGWSTFSRWLNLIAAFDVVFLVLAAITFDFVLGE